MPTLPRNGTAIGRSERRCSEQGRGFSIAAIAEQCDPLHVRGPSRGPHQRDAERGTCGHRPEYRFARLRYACSSRTMFR